MKKKIVVLLGSARLGSINAQLARALERLAAETLDFHFADIEGLPHYNEDLWQTPPNAVVEFRRRVGDSDGVLIVSPEYNRSIPGMLKNALDWGSRPAGLNAWQGKRVAITGAGGAIGTAVAQAHLRSILPVYDMQMLCQPEVYIHFTPGLFGSDFTVAAESTRTFLKSFIDAFANFLEVQTAG